MWHSLGYGSWVEICHLSHSFPYDGSWGLQNIGASRKLLGNRRDDIALKPPKADVPPVGNWRSCVIVAVTLHFEIVVSAGKVAELQRVGVLSILGEFSISSCILSLSWRLINFLVYYSHVTVSFSINAFDVCCHLKVVSLWSSKICIFYLLIRAHFSILNCILMSLDSILTVQISVSISLVPLLNSWVSSMNISWLISSASFLDLVPSF